MNPQRIVDMASAFYDSCVLFTASDLGVFGKLAESGRATAAEIASSCGLDVRAAGLLLDACVAVGLIIKEERYYRNSEEASIFLVPGSPGDLSGAIRYNRDVYGVWGRLPEFVRSGNPAERAEVHLGEDEERTRSFVMAMHGRAMGIGRGVVPQLDLKGRKRVLDIGGGPGTYSMLIAESNPGLRCVVVDLPGIVKVAEELIAGRGMADRVQTVPGDYHVVDLPAGCDAAIIFGVLHQESEQAIRELLGRVYDVLLPGSPVYVLDMMTDASHTQPKFSSLFALNMALTTPNGWVFSDEELRSWLAEAGFGEFSCRPLPPPMPHWLACARKNG